MGPGLLFVLYNIRRLFLPSVYIDGGDGRGRSGGRRQRRFLLLYYPIQISISIFTPIFYNYRRTIGVYLTIYRLVFYRWREIGVITGFDL